MRNYISKVINKLVLAEPSASKLALSFCVGNFMAWAPIIPLQTPLAFLLTWLFRLNITVVMTALYVINNPLTLVPIYMVDYFFGTWLLANLVGIDIKAYNPALVAKFSLFINRYIDLKKYLGTSEICLVCLLVGGFLLGLILSLALYPLMKHVFTKFITKQQ